MRGAIFSPGSRWDWYDFAWCAELIGALGHFNIIPEIVGFMVASVPCDLWSLERRVSVLICSFLLNVSVTGEDFVCFETLTNMALVCKKMMGTLSFGPPFIPSSMDCCVKWTQLFPLGKNELTEKSLRSRFGTMRTSSSLRVPTVLLCCLIGIWMVPIFWQRTVDQSMQEKIVLLVGCTFLQSCLKGVMLEVAPLSMIHPFARLEAGKIFLCIQSSQVCRAEKCCFGVYEWEICFVWWHWVLDEVFEDSGFGWCFF